MTEQINTIEHSTYDGKCKACGDLFKVGDRIFVWNKCYFKHVDCAERWVVDHAVTDEHVSVVVSSQTDSSNNKEQGVVVIPIVKRVIIIMTNGDAFVYGTGAML